MRAFDKRRSGLRAIVFLVDSSTVQKQLRDVAEFLFAVLRDKAVAGDRGLRVLVACNKQVRTRRVLEWRPLFLLLFLLILSSMMMLVSFSPDSSMAKMKTALSTFSYFGLIG